MMKDWEDKSLECHYIHLDRVSFCFCLLFCGLSRSKIQSSRQENFPKCVITPSFKSPKRDLGCEESFDALKPLQKQTLVWYIVSVETIVERHLKPALLTQEDNLLDIRHAARLHIHTLPHSMASINIFSSIFQDMCQLSGCT